MPAAAPSTSASPVAGAATLLAAAAVLAALRLPHGAWGLECYECSSQQESGCADPFSGGNWSWGAWRGPADCPQPPREEAGARAALHTVLTQLTRLGQAPELPPPSGLPPPPPPPPPADGDADDPDEGPPPSCIKLLLTVMGQRVTVRGCAGPALGKTHPCDAYKLIATNEVVLHYCGICESDGCNEQAALRPARAPLLLAMAVCVIACMAL
ncbi:uncharacterized protein LOC126336560 [Schistocerca gregaria]|uniref:uncharacterized protein LOC126336560 n=1 Tax=Schistocerca gregaria TaxID=7010 RepID=UPI00211EF105|nr:uncharacterized protein LOC126336560 [Schistocerca gregaria]